MNDDEDDEIRVLCQRTVDMDEPITASTIRPCERCGVDLWASRALIDELDERYPDREIGYFCPLCVGPVEQEEWSGVLPGQVREMRAAGMTDAEIAHIVAVVKVAGVSAVYGRYDKVIKSIETQPIGRSARRYRREKREVLALLAQMK